MSESVHTVIGMTCGHCAGSVTEELSRLSGVTGTTVDLPTGTVTITSTTPIPLDDVRAAITEAGYELAGR
ncbi:heavy-metal-associated domain-containing protein [Lentzea sp. NPDC058436]|uniref:heavy-metal-associated domain-containing protein n=1 Tax=Lentzea sp. NPDC058436 TaxID=3346499 RepID=UPI003651A3F7